MINEQNYDYYQRGQGGGTGAGIAIGLGLVAIGGLAYFLLKDSKEPGYSVNSKTGWGGAYLGGPNGLGMLSHPTTPSNDAEFNSQKLFYVAQFDGKEILIDERANIWLANLPIKTDASGAVPVTKLSVNSSEWRAMINAISLQNEQQVIGDRIPCAEYDTYLENPSYEKTNEFSVWFPIPLSDGQTSQIAAWRIEKGSVKIEVAKKQVGTKFKRTKNVRVTVESPTIGTWEYIQPGTSGITRSAFNVPDDVAGGYKALYKKFPGTSMIVGEGTNLDGPDFQKLSKLVLFWNNHAQGLLGNGYKAVYGLSSGLNGLRSNTVCFGRGNFFNNATDILEVAKIFELLCMSPKATVQLKQYDEPSLDRFLKCWRANVTRSGEIHATGNLVTPDPYESLITPEEFRQYVNNLGIKANANLRPNINKLNRNKIDTSSLKIR